MAAKKPIIGPTIKLGRDEKAIIPILYNRIKGTKGVCRAMSGYLSIFCVARYPSKEFHAAVYGVG